MTGYQQVCAITARLQSGDGKNCDEGTSSGILIDTVQGIILSHTSLLYPFINIFNPNCFRDLKKTGMSTMYDFPRNVHIEVTLPTESLPEHDLSVTKKSHRNIQPVVVATQDLKQYQQVTGEVKMIFVCKSLQDTISQLMPIHSWHFTDDVALQTHKTNNVSSVTKVGELLYFLLPCLIIIKLQNFCPCKNLLFFRDSKQNKQGDPVEICASPFGAMNPDIFLNSRSRGIISNLAGPHGVLQMTDARCIPGSEGGGLFYCSNGKRVLTGIMIASLCWKNNEWVGLSLACAISEVIRSLNEHFILKIGAHLLDDNTAHLAFLVSKMIPNITCISVGHNWGSGIIIDVRNGICVTCSHVLNGSDISTVRIRYNCVDVHSPFGVCDIVFQTPLHHPLDIAVIQTKSRLSERSYSQITFGKVNEGDVVFVVGYALFKDELQLSPMVTRGIVSKVVTYQQRPVMLQTTCAVHAGASGGGVFNMHGELIAMVVCSSKDTLSGACYPHVNMCIPMESVAPIFQDYFTTKDPNVLKSLLVADKHIIGLWNIGHEATSVASHL